MDFAPRNNFSVIDAFKLHHMTAFVGMFGSPIPKLNSAAVPSGSVADSSSSGASSAPQPSAGAAVPHFNLDACFRMGEGT